MHAALESLVTETTEALDLFEAHRRLDDLESFVGKVNDLLSYLEAGK